MDKNSSVYNSSNQKQEIQLAAGTAYAFEESPGVVFRDAAAAGSDAVRDSVDRMTAPSLSGPQRSGSPYLSNCGWNSPLVPLEGTFETLVQWSPVTVPSNTAKFIGDEQKGGMLLAASVSNAESQASGSTNPQNSSDQHFRTKVITYVNFFATTRKIVLYCFVVMPFFIRDPGGMCEGTGMQLCAFTSRAP